MKNEKPSITAPVAPTPGWPTTGIGEVRSKSTRCTDLDRGVPMSFPDAAVCVEILDLLRASAGTQCHRDLVLAVVRENLRTPYMNPSASDRQETPDRNGVRPDVFPDRVVCLRILDLLRPFNHREADLVLAVVEANILAGYCVAEPAAAV